MATGAGGFEAVTVAEHEEPPAVFGSDLQKLAYPADYQRVRGRRPRARRGRSPSGRQRARHAGARRIRSTWRSGKDGFRVYDIANIDNKDFSERIVTAPVSPLGQRLYVKTKNAVAVATPTTLGVDPLRTQNPENEEQKIHLMYGFLYVADARRGSSSSATV